MIIKLCDSRDDYGTITTNCNKKQIKQLLKDYKKSDEEGYNVDDFITYVQDKGYKCEIISCDLELDF